MSKKDFIALADSIKHHNKYAKPHEMLDYINGECGPSGGKVTK